MPCRTTRFVAVIDIAKKRVRCRGAGTRRVSNVWIDGKREKDGLKSILWITLERFLKRLCKYYKGLQQGISALFELRVRTTISKCTNTMRNALLALSFATKLVFSSLLPHIGFTSLPKGTLIRFCGNTFWWTRQTSNRLTTLCWLAKAYCFVCTQTYTDEPENTGIPRKRFLLILPSQKIE